MDGVDDDANSAKSIQAAQQPAPPQASWHLPGAPPATTISWMIRAS
jgi:hypothetical protein